MARMKNAPQRGESGLVADAALRTRVLIADDQTILREGLRALLEDERGLELLGGVKTPARPDVVLIDLSLPELQGLEAIREVKRRSVGTKVVVLSLHDSPQSLRAALDAGADGYLLKGASRSELVLAIAVVLRGTLFVSPALTRRPAVPALDSLTLRERQVLKRIAEGARNREIAQELALSTKTVEKHRSKLMRKLNLRNIAALTSFAIEHHVTELPNRSPR
jgi:two-component system, NarL family, response regulator NreC